MLNKGFTAITALRHALEADEQPCPCCGDGNGRLVVTRVCDTCGSEYAGQAELDMAKRMAAAKEAEIQEQCRIIGMSAERELRHRTVMEQVLETWDHVRGALAYVALGNAAENPNLARSTCSQAAFALDKAEAVLRQAMEQPSQQEPVIGSTVVAVVSHHLYRSSEQ